MGYNLDVYLNNNFAQIVFSITYKVYYYFHELNSKYLNQCR